MASTKHVNEIGKFWHPQRIGLVPGADEACVRQSARRYRHNLFDKPRSRTEDQESELMQSSLLRHRVILFQKHMSFSTFVCPHSPALRPESL